MDVTSGIRQGCTASTSLCKLITYKIIQKIQQIQHSYTDNALRIDSLLDADDGMILASSIKGAEERIQVIRVSGEYGSEMNKIKIQIVTFNMKDRPEQINGIQVKEEFKYLGILVNGNRKCFKEHRQVMIQKMRRHKWIKETEKYMNEVGIGYEKLRTEKAEESKMEEKKSLVMYRN